MRRRTKVIFIFIVSVLTMLFVFTACAPNSNDDKIIMHSDTAYLSSTVVEQATTEVLDGLGKKTVQAKLVNSQKDGDLMYLEFNIGKIKNCFIQTVSTAMYNDQGLSKYTFTQQEVKSETIAKGISNSISTTKSTSFTTSVESTLSWKIGTSLSSTVSAEVGVNVGIVESKAGVSQTCAIATEAGYEISAGMSEEIAKSVTDQTTESYNVSQIIETTNSATWEYDMSKYEEKYWYVLALVADIEVYQIVAYNTNSREFYTSYFVAEIANNKGGVKMFSSDSTAFNIKEEYQLEPITEINIEKYLPSDLEINPPTGEENGSNTEQKPPIGEGNGSNTESNPPTVENDGSKERPFIIKNEEEFLNLRNNTSKYVYYKLENNLDLGVWNDPFEFTGNLDGNGKTITFYQTIGNSGVNYGGLFSKLNNASVKHLYLDVNISDKSGDNKAIVGGLAGLTQGRVGISQIAVSGSIIMADGIGDDYIGGVIGQFNGGSIEQCVNAALVESHAWNSRAGGIVGYAIPSEMKITISNCYNVGEIKSCTSYIWGGRSAGGIIGQAQGHNSFDLKVSKCYNNSVVRIIQEKNAALGWWGVGGLVGDIANQIYTRISVEESYWNDTVELAGYNSRYHEGNSKTNMNGIYPNWSSEIWILSAHHAPILKWLSN
ncbi:MAG: hypothetical protein HDT32_05875 [Clostridiales bacterium]|nr:hypothetical protein [Clostridiales bacterium]